MMVVIQQTIETEKNLLNFHFGFSDLAIPFLLNPMSKKKKKKRERERKKKEEVQRLASLLDRGLKNLVEGAQTKTTNHSVKY